MLMNEPLSVTELTAHIKDLLESDAKLSALFVRGELSNYKIHTSGHHYFTLKDDGAVINAVMFRGEAGKLRFRPESGMKVILSGRVSLFAKSGQYQIYASDMQPDGVGALYIAFEQLKQKLQAEGLFESARKKPLPQFPRRIALVTSPTGAAVRDMIRVLGHRYPLCSVLVCPVKVQGDGSALEIAQMLDYVNEHRLASLIIAGRGGGSIEDLWAFNEEAVAQAIARSRIPVISAVGHEPDVTIADFVADVRAATPSNAAELAVRDARQIKARLSDLQSLLTRSAAAGLDGARAKLNSLAQKKIMSSPYEYLNERKMVTEMLASKLEHAGAGILEGRRRRYAALSASLDALSPLKVLSRGYTMASAGGAVVKTVRELSVGDRVTLTFADGNAVSTVESIERNKKNG